MDKKTMAFLLIIELIVAILINKLFIPFLTKLKFGQSIRKEGPAKHLKKEGTPTMGGLAILFTFSVMLTAFLAVNKLKGLVIDFGILLLMLIPIYGFALIGFLDDFLIIVKKNNQGLKPTIKLLLQLVISLVCFLVYLELELPLSINFFGSNWNLGFLYGALLIIIFTSTTNATNLTDGLDGLLSITSIFSILAFGILAYMKQNYTVLSVVIAMSIAIISFLFFNFPKAQVFMGDTGSLMIGATISSLAIVLKYEILLIIIGMVYVIETLSVILQVWFFKRTKGQRLFRMSPFHHHLEMCGLDELEIDLLLGFASFLFGLLGIYMGVVLF